MKKIFYILASAIVALGAVACENDVMDNIATVEGDTVSFVAAIDDTKTDLTADNKTVWDEDDTISITWTDANGERTDVFSNKETGDKNKFTCTADGLAAITEAQVVATYSHNGDGNIDSEAGKAGSLLTYSGAFGALKFQVQNAFLKFTAAEGDVVTLTASEEIFSTTDGTTFNIVATGEAQYVAILPATTTITYAINDVVCTTSKENALVAGKIYTLGELDKVVTIKTEEDLLAFAEAVNNGTTYAGYTVKVANEIDITGAEWNPVGQTGATQFQGTFDGQGFAIKGLTINAPESYSKYYATGMFGWVETSAVIKNVKLDGATINGYHYVGAIAGYISGSAKIQGCEVVNSAIVADPTKLDTSNEFNGDKVGGIVGHTNSGNTISGNKVSATTIKGYRHMGGIVGYLIGTAENNTVDETVVITVDNTNPYKDSYVLREHYGVNSIAGNVAGGTLTNNTGEATIEWGEIPAELVPVASVNGTEYTDLGEAIAAANGATVTLMADVELDEALTVAADNAVTIALNGKTISGTSDVESTFALIKNNGTLTLTGEGGVATYQTDAWSETNSYASNTISNYGTLVVDGNITISNTSEGSACYAIDNYAGSTCTIKNGTITAKKTAVRIFNWEASKNTTLNVEGGTILSEDGYAINTNTGEAPNYTINISGGTITTNDTDYNLAVYMVAKGTTDGSNYKFNVTGGTFNGAFAINGNSCTLMKEGNVEISGGTFNDGVIAYGTPAVKFITGGVYASNPAEYGYVADGYVTYMDGENYVVASMTDALKVADEISVYGEIDLAEVSLDGYTGTIVGATDAAVLNTRNYTTNSTNEFYPIQGSEITFKNIDIWFPTEDGDFLLTGIMSRSTLTFDNCDFEGQFTLNGAGTWTFNECDFVSTVEGAYASFVYGAANTVQFNTCSFSGVDRAAKVYGTGGTLNVVYDNCTFTSTKQNKAAVNVDARFATTTIDLNNGCSQTGMGELYALVGTKGVIYIDGTQVAPIPYVAKVGETSYTSLEDAITAADGSTVELLADATVSQACVIDTKGFNLTVGDDAYRAVLQSGTTYKVELKPAVLRINNMNGWGDLNVTIKSGENTLVNAQAMTNAGDNIFYYELDAQYIGTEITYYITHSWYQTSTKTVTVTADTDPIVLNTTYLQPNSDGTYWGQADAWFVAYMWNGSTNVTVKATAVKDNFYEVEIPTNVVYTNIIWVRKNPANSSLDFTGAWNQTSDLTLKHNCYCVNSWDQSKLNDSRWY